MTMVTKTKNGKTREVTPVHNFVETAGYRVDMILDQLERLSKQHGKNYEYTPEHLDKIQETILEKLATSIDNLRKPGKAKKTDGFATVLSKC